MTDQALIFDQAKSLDEHGQRETALGLILNALASDPLLINTIAADYRSPFALAVFQRLRALYPQDAYVRMTLWHLAREQCDYTVMAEEEPKLLTDIAAGKTEALAAEQPHGNLMWQEDEGLNRLARLIGPFTPWSPQLGKHRRAMAHNWADKIRIGYLSSDFWDDHATMRLFRSVLTAHDPKRYEIVLFCYTDEKMLSFDRGGRSEWGRIVLLAGKSDEEAERLIRQEQIDILVDLKGHTRGTRSNLMNRSLAPVHVQWLGFPGSCIDVDCDYVIGDRFVLPDSSACHYHEAFCRLPESYQPNDPFHRPLSPPVKRLSLGLPEGRVIIGAFNSQRKNTPETLRLWAKVLQDNPQALLWLMIDGQKARQSTAAFFKTLGIKQSQLLFAPKMAYDAHLARVQAADFAVDTFPYNGHTTTSDMLWAGVPVITRKGRNFASRVSESLLNAIGLPQLVAEDEAGFVALASDLIRYPEKRAALRQHLDSQRFIAPLFDAERFCRHLESAFETMVARAQKGLDPAPFDVAALPERRSPFSSAEAIKG